MTAETRSVYSGPIRRSLDRLDRARGGLTGELAALEARVATAEAEVAKLPRGVVGVGGPVWYGSIVVATGQILTNTISVVTKADRLYKATFNIQGWYGPGSLAFGLCASGVATSHGSWAVSTGNTWTGDSFTWYMPLETGVLRHYDVRITNYQISGGGGDYVIAGSNDMFLMIEDIGPKP